jgi:hypothetical protein
MSGVALIKIFYKSEDRLHDEYYGPVTPVHLFGNKHDFFIIEAGCDAGGKRTILLLTTKWFPLALNKPS